MSWLRAVAAITPFEGVLGLRPELLQRYRAFYATLFDTRRVPPRVREICRLRIAAIHDCAQEWNLRDAHVQLTEHELRCLSRGELSAFTGVERAALDVAERIPYQHHAITDAQVAELAGLLGADGAVALLVAAAFFDATCRLKVVLDIDSRVLELDRPPFHEGALA